MIEKNIILQTTDVCIYYGAEAGKQDLIYFEIDAEKADIEDYAEDNILNIHAHCDLYKTLLKEFGAFEPLSGSETLISFEFCAKLDEGLPYFNNEGKVVGAAIRLQTGKGTSTIEHINEPTKTNFEFKNNTVCLSLFNESGLYEVLKDFNKYQ